MIYCYVFFFKQKTAYEMRISDWSSDVCSSDLSHFEVLFRHLPFVFEEHVAIRNAGGVEGEVVNIVHTLDIHREAFEPVGQLARHRLAIKPAHLLEIGKLRHLHPRSEEHTSALQ